ncbi:MAG TPA: DNA alkylation response protein, partial [Burkholderiaceae bacterium]
MSEAPRPARSPEGVPDSRGLNLFDADPSYRGLLALHLGEKLCAHLEPQFVELGRLAGGELDELAL